MSVSHISDKAKGSSKASSGNTGQPPAALAASITHGCRGTTQSGRLCHMRPMPSGYCMAHDPGRSEERRAERSRAGKLRAAHAVLARRKAELVAKYGIQGELPTLDSVETMGTYLATVAARIETRQLTPAQANSLVGVVRMAKDLLALGIDVKLAELLEQESR